jgi:hypothetical protein
MGQSRTLLSEILHGICNTVYFQPPDKQDMSFPCIVYQRVGEEKLFADNNQYRDFKKYTVTVIDRNPDSPISVNVSKIRYIKLSERFVTDNLYHDAYTLYF